MNRAGNTRLSQLECFGETDYHKSIDFFLIQVAAYFHQTMAVAIAFYNSHDWNLDKFSYLFQIPSHIL